MIKINKISTYLAHAHKLPTHVQEDINKRMSDWLESGGTLEDPYIQQQYRYAENVLNSAEQVVNRAEQAVNKAEKLLFQAESHIEPEDDTEDFPPFVAFGNDELDENAPVGSRETCPNCGELHEVGYGETVKPDGTREPSDLLAFISCPENDATYLIGIKGKLINRPSTREDE